LFLWVSAAPAAEAIIRDQTHFSNVLGEERNYRVFLPPDYESSGKRYPVIYWFHGYSERHNRPVAMRPVRNYDVGADYGGDTISRFVGANDVIVVKWDGYNPRQPGENYPRPYNISPVETSRQFPLYFPELVDHIDSRYRTFADREHRATAGLSMGGFMSFWVAGKYPHLVGSASNFMGSSEFFVGPRGFDVEYRHEEMRDNYEGLRTRIVMGKRDFIQFYHRRMNAIWNFTRPFHETEEFDFDHGTPGMGKTLAFHMRAFADPLPRPAVWSHAEVYPNFTVWGWEVASDRRQPGFTVLENASAAGFRSAVREWLPGGRTIPQVKLSLATAPRLYRPRSKQVVTRVRLRDGATQRREQAADGEGRLHLELDGDEYEVGIGKGGVLAVAGADVEGAAWATAGAVVRVRVRFLNKGGGRSGKTRLRWETSNPGVEIQSRRAEVPRLEPGETAEVMLAFQVRDQAREIVKLFAAGRGMRLPLELPLFPLAAPAPEFRISDGSVQPIFERAIQKTEARLGEGNGDGKAAPGERIVVLLADDGRFRPAELFTNDRCVDLSVRVSDVWSRYDNVGASAKYSLPLIRRDCPPGHVVRMMARVQLPDKPNHKVRYATIEFPVGAGGSPTTK
jgi:hypothetical protein